MSARTTPDNDGNAPDSAAPSPTDKPSSLAPAMRALAVRVRGSVILSLSAKVVFHEILNRCPVSGPMAGSTAAQNAEIAERCAVRLLTVERAIKDLRAAKMLTTEGSTTSRILRLCLPDVSAANNALPITSDGRDPHAADNYPSPVMVETHMQRTTTLTSDGRDVHTVDNSETETSLYYSPSGSVRAREQAGAQVQAGERTHAHAHEAAHAHAYEGPATEAETPSAVAGGMLPGDPEPSLSPALPDRHPAVLMLRRAMRDSKPPLQGNPLPPVRPYHASKIIATVGHSPEALAAWDALLWEWRERGWEFSSIPALLDRFERDYCPADPSTRAASGTTATGPAGRAGMPAPGAGRNAVRSLVEGQTYDEWERERFIQRGEARAEHFHRNGFDARARPTYAYRTRPPAVTSVGVYRRPDVSAVVAEQEANRRRRAEREAAAAAEREATALRLARLDAEADAHAEADAQAHTGAHA